MQVPEYSFGPTRLFHGEGLVLEYTSTSDDPERDCILCFHGFGRSYTDFNVFLPLIRDNQRLVAIHLFGHGASVIPSQRLLDEPLRAEELGAMFRAFLDVIKAESIHILAYSMGGRVAMTMANLLPERVKSLLLIATDGLKKNLLYSFASNTALGRKLSRFTIHKSGWLFATADALAAVGLLSPKLRRFVYVHLDTEEKRRLVFSVWLFHRFIFPDLRFLGYWTAQRNVPVHMIFGQYDEVIPTRLGRRVEEEWGRKTMVHTLPMGHRLLSEVLCNYVQEHRLWPM
jgi:pimeloyl-ACP methyl ester carboxylesterase